MNEFGPLGPDPYLRRPGIPTEPDNEAILNMLTAFTGMTGSQIMEGFQSPFPAASPHAKTLLFLYGLLIYTNSNDKYCRNRLALLEDMLKKMQMDGLPSQKPEESKEDDSKVIRDVVEALVKMASNLEELSKAQAAKEPLSADVFRESLEQNFDGFADSMKKSIAKANFTAGMLPMLGCLLGGAALGFVAAKFL